LKKLLALAGLLCVITTHVPAVADPTPMSLDMIGVGPHGYDLLIGHWKCAGSMTSPSGQSIHLTSTSSIEYRGEADGSISWVALGSGTHVGLKAISDTTFRWPPESHEWSPQTGGLRYTAETQKWSISYANHDGISGEESTRDTGQEAVWTGSELSIEGSPTHIRDTMAFSSPTSYVDKSEYQLGRSWLIWGNVTCSKS
jgi:hypothetical protein